MTDNYWIKLSSREKQSEKVRFNYLMQKIDEGGGEPLFKASAAYHITTAMVNAWTAAQSEPIFTSSAAHCITNEDLTKLKTGYENRIASLETTVAAYGTRITSLESQLSTLQNTVNRLDNDLKNAIATGG